MFISCKQCYVPSIGIGHSYLKSIGIGSAGENWYRCITNDKFGSHWYNMDKNTVNAVLDVGFESTIRLPLLIMAGSSAIA